MSLRCVLPVLLALLATQTAQAAGLIVLPSSQHPSQMVTPPMGADETEQPSLNRAAVIERPESTPGGLDPANGMAQSQPQRQVSQSHPHQHTLRGIVIIFVAVGVMIIVLAAAAKK